MKKITLSFFFLISSFLGFSQINEGFEGATFPPTTAGNWIVQDNGVGTAVNWIETTDPTRVRTGLKAALVERDIIPVGTISEDWLITSQFVVPANGQLRFFTRLGLLGNNGTTFDIKASTNATQTNQAAFTTTLATYTESTIVNPATYNVYEEKIINFPAALVGQSVYVAFIKVFNRTSAIFQGDRWLIDDVKVLERCLDPSILTVGVTTPTTASLAWTNNGSATQWEVEVIPATNTPTGTGIPASTNPFVVTGLTPDTQYKYYVRSLCSTGTISQWIGPFNFFTKPSGSICTSPIAINTLPFSQSSNTNLFGDEVDTPQGTSCGAVPTTTNYLQGDEVFYSYTPTFTGLISISMTSTVANSSIFVYGGCPIGGSCLAGVANTATTPRIINNFGVTVGQTYIIVISSSTNPTPASGIPYSLIIQQENCTKPAALTATNIGTTTANLSWSNPSAATTWEVEIQPAGSAIPSGAGTLLATTNTNFAITGLTAATAYQYWVRSDCGSGIFSAWSGPFLFNTNICEAAQRCIYNFRTNDSFGDGWNDNTMSVRQNGVVVATIVGPTDPDNLNFIDQFVPLCETLPFELFWNAGGSFANEVGISIINNFNQTLYTKPPGTGSQNSILYAASFDCDTPACLPPNTLTTTNITTSTANLGWTANGSTFWDIYLIPAGVAAPTATTTPTYANVSTNPFGVINLTPITSYDFYIRSVCSSSVNSNWAGPQRFITPDTNDECFGSRLVPVNQNTRCTQTVTGTVGGATASVQSNTCGAVNDDDDVWFHFTATASTHYISLLEPTTSTANPPVFSDVFPTGLNYSLYTGSCNALTQISCRTTNGSIETALIVGETYRIRVYTSGTSPSTKSFEICVGTKNISCNNAFPLCTIAPIIIRNDVGVPPLPNPISGSTTSDDVGCLGSAPSPTYYFLTLPTSGDYNFFIEQSTDPSFATTDLDVDYVAWGPFASTGVACSSITVNNTRPGPDGCSFSAASTENFKIMGGIAGQTYILMITNYTASFSPGKRGYIRISQTLGPILTNCCPYTNFSYPGSFFCKDGANPTPTLDLGATAGPYTSTAGLVINSATGEINLATSALGTYIVTSIIPASGGATGCLESLNTWSVTISDPPTATIAYSQAIFCKDDAGIQNIIQTGNSGGYYSSSPVGLTLNITTGDIIPSNSLLGSYTVNYIVTNVSGCPVFTTSTSVTINPTPTGTLVSSDADNTICSNETGTLTFNPTNFIATDATYVWTLNGVILPTATTNVISPAASGTYQVVATLNGCGSVASSILFTVNPQPNFTLSDTNLIKCVNEFATITVVPTNFSLTDPLVTYVWSLDGVVQPALTTNTISQLLAYGNYSVVVSRLGCSSLPQSKEVTLDTTDIAFNTEGECVGNNYIITSTPISGSFIPSPTTVTYQWTNESGTIVGSNQNTFNVTDYVITNNVSPSSFPISFTVKVTTIPDGCTDSQIFEVKSASCVIQKGLSPNGDGSNDSFDLRGLDVKQLSIFNRYGTKIYSQANYKDEWQGQNSKSENSPVGTYYYVIELNNGETKTGWVYLNR